MVDIIHHTKPIKCDICNALSSEIFELDLGDTKYYCMNCLQHRFGTQTTLEFMKKKITGRHF